jgi:hypothetical protein
MVAGVIFVLSLPLKLPNPLNGSHQHWATKARIRSRLRAVVLMAVRPRVQGITLPVTVTITRIANSGGLDPHDGLPASCKPVVDAIAEAMGVDDRDPRVTWAYAQRRGRGYSVEIAIRTAMEMSLGESA